MHIPYDLIGLILGILGLVEILPMVWALARRQLPRRKMKELKKVIKETTALLDAEERAGFLPDPDFVLSMRSMIALSQAEADCIRPIVLRASTTYQQLVGAISGLSGQIWLARDKILRVRQSIVMVGDKERRKVPENLARPLRPYPSRGEQNLGTVPSPPANTSTLPAIDIAMLAAPNYPTSHMRGHCVASPLIIAAGDLESDLPSAIQMTSEPMGSPGIANNTEEATSHAGDPPFDAGNAKFTLDRSTLQHMMQELRHQITQDLKDNALRCPHSPNISRVTAYPSRRCSEASVSSVLTDATAVSDMGQLTKTSYESPDTTGKPTFFDPEFTWLSPPIAAYSFDATPNNRVHFQDPLELTESLPHETPEIKDAVSALLLTMQAVLRRGLDLDLSFPCPNDTGGDLEAGQAEVVL